MAAHTYVVTGASRGLGKAICIQLAKSGMRVVLLARRSENLDSVVNLVKIDSPESFAVACDLSSTTDIDEAIAKICSECQRIDGIIHNAGVINPVIPASMVENEQWNLNLQVNLLSVQQLTKGLIPLMGGDTQSRITTISSGASLRPVQSWSAYCVAKAGLDMWTRCIASELEEKKISAIAIAPGIVDTGMQEDIRASDPENFPDHSNFVSYHSEGMLVDADEVAGKLMPLITNHEMSQTGERFDVRELD